MLVVLPLRELMDETIVTSYMKPGLRMWDLPAGILYCLELPET